jgi:beta-lactam-binding protein with PASTA domain
MQAFLSFFKSRQFLINFLLILVFIFGTYFVINAWLSSYTGHGEFVQVPDFKGQKITELDNFVDGRNVAYKIIDSIYDPRQEPGVVLRQDPDAETHVKHNRTVYLYVTGMVAPQIVMPKLIDRSERQARLIIETYGLKVGRIIEKAADCNGCVLSQSIKGKYAEPGSNVKKGSVIDIEIGRKDKFYTSHSDSVKTENEEPNFDDDKND